MVYFSMKRGREDDQINESITTMANYLLLLSQANNLHDFNGIMIGDSSPMAARVFECKTCNRQFSSFQALGGHRASHKKPRVMLGGSNINDQDQEELLHAKPKVHECSICGLEFALGQALGGHMRRHKGVNDGGDVKENIIPVVKKSNSRRIVCLDLNLTPLENDLEFQVGKMTNAVDNFV